MFFPHLILVFRLNLVNYNNLATYRYLKCPYDINTRVRVDLALMNWT